MAIEAKNVVMVWVMVASCLTGSPSNAQVEGRSTLDGVYTDVQAQRGSGLYQQHCARCHSHREFSGHLFEAVWVNGTLGALFYRIANTMPMDQPGSLSTEQASALVSFILRNNGYPPGQSALPQSLERLSEIIVSPPPEMAP